jgi:hypothetical protein
MLRALLNTLVPARPDRTVEFELPKMENPNDAFVASAAVIAACAAGEVSPPEARQIMELISVHVTTTEVAMIEQRLAALEGMMQNRQDIASKPEQPS